jgi:hypothetical protein
VATSNDVVIGGDRGRSALAGERTFTDDCRAGDDATGLDEATGFDAPRSIPGLGEIAVTAREVVQRSGGAAHDGCLARLQSVDQADDSRHRPSCRRVVYG